MIIVTGGAGFIGSNIVQSILDKGKNEVLVCDILESDIKKQVIEKLGITNIVSPAKLFNILRSERSSVKTIIHMGAITDTTESDINLILENNYYFSMKLWNWCAENRVQFIYASSAATYGDGFRGFDDNNNLSSLSHLKPLNAYAWSKHLFDQRVLRSVSRKLPVPPCWAGLKFFNVYGPHENHKGTQSSVALQIYNHITQGKAVRLFRSHNPKYQDGKQMRDFIHVEDCVSVISWLLNNQNIGSILNVGTGKARSFLDVAYAVSNSMGQSLNIDWIDIPENIRNQYQYFTEAKVDRLRGLGFKKSFLSLEEGIDRYIKYFFQNY